MNVINKKSISVVNNGGRAITRSYVMVSNKCIYFTAAIARECGLEVGLYVQFINDEAEWKFYVNDDPDGFKLTPNNWSGGFNIGNTGLTKMILKSMGFNKEKRLVVIKTDLYIDKCRIYELSTQNVPEVIR